MTDQPEQQRPRAPAHTAWAHNLLRDPRIVVHPPDPERVVAIEGVAGIIEDDDLGAEEWRDLDTRFQAKYDVGEGSPYGAWNL